MSTGLIVLAAVLVSALSYFLVGYLVLLSYRLINPYGFRNDLKNDRESLRLIFCLWPLMAIIFPIFCLCEFFKEKVIPYMKRKQFSPLHFVFFMSNKETKEKKIDLLEKTR